MAIFFRLWWLWTLLAVVGCGFVWLKRHDHAIREEVRAEERAACDERFAKANAAAEAENARLKAEWQAHVDAQAAKYAKLQADMAHDAKYYESKLAKLRAAARTIEVKDQADAAANPMDDNCTLSPVAFGLRIDAIDRSNVDPG